MNYLDGKRYFIRQRSVFPVYVNYRVFEHNNRYTDEFDSLEYNLLNMKSYVSDYEEIYRRSVQDPDTFWSEIASELDWYKKWDRVLDWNYPHADWFKGARCNIVANSLDRHLKAETGDKLALVWEGVDGNVRQYTYRQLNTEVCKTANALKKLGVKKGDIITVYLPKLPEQIISMLAVAKIGAVHNVVFSGFSADALQMRLKESESQYLITCNAYMYRDKKIDLKSQADKALEGMEDFKNCLVVRHLNEDYNLIEGRDLDFNTLITEESDACPTEEMAANDPLFILYTSGTTGKPKAALHAHGGYMVGTFITSKWVFNLEPGDVYWCSADAGWITGHSYIVYGPLQNGVTVYLYEGPPDYPDPGIWWSKIEKHQITKFYTAPTAIRGLMRYGESWPSKYDLSSLKILGSVGEPINPEAWNWFNQVIGDGKCPIMDTWWQTETGMHLLTPLPSVKLKPGSVFKPFPGVEMDVVNEKGESMPFGEQGFLVVKTPWPSMFKTLFKNDNLYQSLYWNKIPGVYTTGDLAKRDEEGYYYVLGRADDVISVSGHRIGSAEVEAAVNAHPKVSESAAVGLPDEITGEKILVFVILKQNQIWDQSIQEEIKQIVAEHIGPIAKPRLLKQTDKLPKTRSGKIVRRLLRAQELGLDTGDLSTLED